MEFNGLGIVKRSQHDGNIIGMLFLWCPWIIISSLLLSATKVDEQTNELFSAPMFTWLIFGPLLVFMFIGRFIAFNRNMDDAWGTNLANLKISLLIFISWFAIGSLLYLGGIFLPNLENLVVGLIFCYAALVYFNEKWNF